MENLTKVKMPLWWTEGEEVYGYTDCENTACCSFDICWFVEVPYYEYYGYFKVSDLEVVDTPRAACSANI